MQLNAKGSIAYPLEGLMVYTVFINVVQRGISAKEGKGAAA